MDGSRILIVEDEVELAEILGEYLKIEGYETVIAHDGEGGMKQFLQTKPQLAILDIMLPKRNGIEVCKEIRKTSDIPIIMLSAKNGEMDKVISLGAGADDYVTKPFSPLELVARVKAQTRRYLSFLKQEKQEEKRVKAGRLTLDSGSYEAYIDETLLEFTTKEFEMLYFFATHLNQVFSKEQLYEQIWGMNEYGDISSVAVYIKRIRTKLEAYEVDYIKTIWGVGYKLVTDRQGRSL